MIWSTGHENSFLMPTGRLHHSIIVVGCFLMPIQQSLPHTAKAKEDKAKKEKKEKNQEEKRINCGAILYGEWMF